MLEVVYILGFVVCGFGLTEETRHLLPCAVMCCLAWGRLGRKRVGVGGWGWPRQKRTRSRAATEIQAGLH